MKPGVEIIGVFEQQKDEHGNEHFTGTLDPAAFKKAKQDIHLILMKGNLLPTSLVGSNPASQESIFMFSQNEPGVR